MASAQFILSGRARYPVAESAGMLAHFALYVALLATVLQPWQAGVFVLVHQGLMGFYMGSVFAPNHKGMALIDRDAPVDFFHRQVLTTRYGLHNGRRHTLDETAQILAPSWGRETLSRERIRQVEAEALRKLRHPVRGAKLRRYLEGE